MTVPTHTLLAGVLLLLGCSGEPSGDFTVTLAGPVEGTIRGNAVFCRTDAGGLLLALTDPQTSAGFLLGRGTPEVPPPGSYGVVAESDTRAAAAFWLRPELRTLEGAAEYNYRVRGGKVRIVSADSSWIRGRFEAEAIATDASPQIDVASGKVRLLPTEKVDVRGQFAAARSESCALPGEGER